MEKITLYHHSARARSEAAAEISHIIKAVYDEFVKESSNQKDSMANDVEHEV